MTNAEQFGSCSGLGVSDSKLASSSIRALPSMLVAFRVNN